MSMFIKKHAHVSKDTIKLTYDVCHLFFLSAIVLRIKYTYAQTDYMYLITNFKLINAI